MSFDLRITFTGLCLFTHDPQRNRMHVLLPDTTHGGPGGNHRHLAMLIYDTAYATPGASELSRSLACKPMKDRKLELIGWGGTGADSRLPREMANMDDLVACPLRRKLVDGDPRPGATSRITLDAGCLTSYEAGVIWKHPNPKWGDAKPLTWQADWTIRGIEGAGLDRWELTPFGVGVPTELPALHPIGETIHFFIFNVVESELPPPMGGSTPNPPGKHFAFYYNLFDRGCVPDRRVPDYKTPGRPESPIKSDCRPPESAPRPAQGGMRIESASAIEQIRGAIPLSCMLAKATLE